MRKLKGLIAIVITLWGMMFSLPLLYGETTFKKSAFGIYEGKRLLLNKVICGHKFEIPQTFDECNGFKSIKVPKPSKFVAYYTSDRSYKVKPVVFECYDFSGKSHILYVRNADGSEVHMSGDKVTKVIPAKAK